MSDKGIDTERMKVPDGGGCEATNGPTCILTRVSVESGELDRLFSILSSRRRRFVLYHLVTGNKAVVERAALATAVLAHEQHDESTEEPPPKNSIVRDLHHSVLPRLKDEGYIDYDPRQGTIRYDGPPELANCLITIRALERSRDERRETT